MKKKKILKMKIEKLRKTRLLVTKLCKLSLIEKKKKITFIIGIEKVQRVFR